MHAYSFRKEMRIKYLKINYRIKKIDYRRTIADCRRHVANTPVYTIEQTSSKHQALKAGLMEPRRLAQM